MLTTNGGEKADGYGTWTFRIPEFPKESIPIHLECASQLFVISLNNLSYLALKLHILSLFRKEFLSTGVHPVSLNCCNLTPIQVFSSRY
jgi:hypothetical protein